MEFNVFEYFKDYKRTSNGPMTPEEQGTSLFLAASSLPFAIWLMKNFIDAVPEELEESAEIEGASSLRILLRIIIPLTIPGIGVTAIVTFINGWGAFLIPLVLNSNPSDTPASIMSGDRRIRATTSSMISQL